MSHKEGLTNALNKLLIETDGLEAWIPKVKRVSSRNYEHWAPKDLIAHSVEWTKRQVHLLTDTDEALSGGEESENMNQVIFDRHIDTPWDEVIDG